MWNKFGDHTPPSSWKHISCCDIFFILRLAQSVLLCTSTHPAAAGFPFGINKEITPQHTTNIHFSGQGTSGFLECACAPSAAQVSSKARHAWDFSKGHVSRERKTLLATPARTRNQGTPTITFPACTEHQHTIQHASLLKQIEKNLTNEYVWLGCGSHASRTVGSVAQRSARLRTIIRADKAPTFGVKKMLPCHRLPSWQLLRLLGATEAFISDCAGLIGRTWTR